MKRIVFAAAISVLAFTSVANTSSHYAGPRHVLDLANELALNAEQTAQSQALFDAMKAEATTLGAQFVAKEQTLDRHFADGSIDADSLKSLLSEIGALQAKIRHVHLSTHLKQQALLSKHQIKMYDQLRGYGKQASSHHHHSH